MFKTFLRDESGASAAEYALILAIVGAGIAGGAVVLGEPDVEGAGIEPAEEVGLDADPGSSAEPQSDFSAVASFESAESPERSPDRTPRATRSAPHARAARVRGPRRCQQRQGCRVEQLRLPRGIVATQFDALLGLSICHRSLSLLRCVNGPDHRTRAPDLPKQICQLDI